MTGYQPFLIAPFKTGLDTDVEPWLAPVDAFTDIVNGHIHHGYLEKREGYRFLAQLVHGREITGASNASPAVFTVATATGLSDGQSVTLSYMAGGSPDWSGTNGAVYTIDNLSGTTFNLLDSDGVAIDGADYGTYTASTGRLGNYEGSRVMGIFRYIAADNTRDMLAGDRERVAIYNGVSNQFQPLDLMEPTLTTVYPDNDHFAGTALDYIWAANWQHAGAVNRVYFTNGKAFTGGTPGTDGILYYDATNRGTPANPVVVQLQPTVSATGPTILYGCKLIFSIKQRLVCLHTFEYDSSNTNTFPQRARWCAAQDPSNWNQDSAGGGGFVDAPTGEQIISARLLQDVIIVHFTESVWTLRPVPDPALPFRWDRINAFRACDGKMASVGYDRYSVGVGVRGITATDGVETRRVDERIEDFTTDEISDDQFGKVFAARSYGNRRTWFLYASENEDDADRALIYDDESSAYTQYNIGMNVLGYGVNAQDYAAQDFVEANDLDKAAEDFDDETALSFFWSKGAEIFLGGDRTGKVHILETENTDDGTDIAFEVTSAAWNPFKEQGVEAQLGYVDFFVDSNQNTTLEVDFYKDNNEDEYVTQSLDMMPNLNYRSSIGNVVINSDPTTGFTVTANSHGLSASDTCFFYGVTGGTWLNDVEWPVGATVAENSFTVDTDITSLGFAITGATAANPCVITAANHGFSNGDRIYLVDIGGMVELNDIEFTVANVTTNTFELEGIDSSAYTAYTSGGYAFKVYLNGGKIVERKFYRTKVWKRAYAGGLGYQHRIKISSPASSNALKIHAFKAWFRPRGRRELG